MLVLVSCEALPVIKDSLRVCVSARARMCVSVCA